ncbi:MAG: AraC family transcriptional regulator [bacterium]|nr:AraC family transcriptional regulator [bacterium]
MGNGNHYLDTLYRLYYELSVNTPKALSMEFPSELGGGRITQLPIKHGVVLSDWQMYYQSDADLNVQGPMDEEYIQIIFCMNDGVSWESRSKHRSLSLQKKEACIYASQGGSEAICYRKNHNYCFKSIKIPASYFWELLSDYFEGQELLVYKKKLWEEYSKVPITPMMEQLLAEMGQFSQYQGSLGYLYLDGKLRELLAIYLGEVLELDILMGKDTSLSRTERIAIMEAKQRIDSQLAFAPSREELSELVHLSVPKLSSGFSSLYGTSIHQYIIEQRLKQASQLLLDGEWTVSEIATRVGYGKPSNFSAAFKKKYGVVPKNYREARFKGL